MHTTIPGAPPWGSGLACSLPMGASGPLLPSGARHKRPLMMLSPFYKLRFCRAHGGFPVQAPPPPAQSARLERLRRGAAFPWPRQGGDGRRLGQAVGASQSAPPMGCPPWVRETEEECGAPKARRKKIEAAARQRRTKPPAAVGLGPRGFFGQTPASQPGD